MKNNPKQIWARYLFWAAGEAVLSANNFADQSYIGVALMAMGQGRDLSDKVMKICLDVVPK